MLYDNLPMNLQGYGAPSTGSYIVRIIMVNTSGIPCSTTIADQSLNRKSHDDLFAFRNDTAPVIPRAWERFAKSPFALHHKGQKVWKRYELRSKDKDKNVDSETDAQTGLEISEQQASDYLAACARPVKRLCLDHALNRGEEVNPNMVTNYFATLRDWHAGTPRREEIPLCFKDLECALLTKCDSGKVSKRKSLKRGTPNAKNTGEDNKSENQSLPNFEPRFCLADRFKASIEGSDAALGALNNLEDQSLQQCRRISLTSHPTTSRWSTLDGANQICCAISPESTEPDAPEQPALEISDEPQFAVLVSGREPDNPLADTIEYPRSAVRIPKAQRNYGTLMIETDNNDSIPRDQSEEHVLYIVDGTSTNKNIVDDMSTSATLPKVPVQNNIEDAFVASNPKMEQSHLQGLEEIFLVSSPSNPAPGGINKFSEKSYLIEYIRPTVEQQLDKSTSESAQLDIPRLSTYSADASTSLQATTDHSVTINDPQFDDTSVHGRANVVGGPCEQPPRSAVESSGAFAQPFWEDKSSLEIRGAIHGRGQICDYTQDNPLVVTPSPRVVEAHRSVPADGQRSEGLPSDSALSAYTNVSATIKEQPESRTRSGARFSDDTILLKDFLNRAQAQKAGKVEKPVPSASGPIASPRKPLAVIDRNSPSPKKSKSRANRLLTPPSKPKLAATFNDANPLNGHGSCRRSARTRSPAPPKTPSGAPSLIPVRRADGTEHVLLQRSGAQELATITRANTRRNKGHAKPPKLILENLAPQIPDVWLDAKHPKGSVKAVSWDETLAYFFTTKEGENEKENQVKARPKAKRLKGLATTNGTPAPKKTITDVATSNGESALKRRTKIRK